MRKMSEIIGVISVILFFMVSSGWAMGPERRKDQFDQNSGYLIIPAPYNYPGIGEGLMLVGYMGNIMQTSTDAFIIGLTGDAEGYVSSMTEFFVIPKLVYLSASRLDIRKFGVNFYSTRGMESEKEDYNIYVGNKYVNNEFLVTLSLFDRRLETGIVFRNATGRATEILDSEGILITKIENPDDFHSKGNGLRLQLDLTDDFNDPRAGLRYNMSFDKSYAEEVDNPEFMTLANGLTWYLPLMKESTMVFHLFRSDAFVSHEGNTNLERLLEENGYAYCQYVPDQAACEKAKLEEAQNTINANTNGTAHALGGPDRLRSYPQGRYQAAHTLLYGTEFRWNYNTSTSNMDLYFFNDIMQAMQFVFFLEQGSVSEKQEDLGKIVRSTAGTGVRLVGGSGNVYRLEYATGDEGGEVIIMFQYPWRGVD
ncbi:MAG: hypothetical protein HQM12_07295 [SAR324 cluster bacterium]|nr:hypothetical protein [SAR324 cluster bacterium]